MDNMGGIVSAEFILQKECKVFANYSNQCIIILVEGAEWKPLKMQYMGFNLKIISKTEDAGIYYQITGSVNLLPDNDYIQQLEFNLPILIRYKLADGKCKILGTNEYPLITTLEYLDPQKASSFKGYQLSFEGKQLIAPPFTTI